MSNLRYIKLVDYLKRIIVINLKYFYSVILLCGCSGLEKAENERLRRKNAIAEPILRMSNHQTLSQAPELIERTPYSWEISLIGNHLPITQEYFRCRGSARHEMYTHKNQPLFDCSGLHSLPLKDGKEYIWPTLINILNHLQAKTGKRVIVTCGHRCPAHNTYSDPSIYNRASKHQIGAEVDFYIEGLENDPEQIISLIQDYYPSKPFDRYQKGNLNVRTQPWFNKEIFVKLYHSDEGRDLDNQHPHPYISIQMRYDLTENKHITYTWDKAFKGFLRE